MPIQGMIEQAIKDKKILEFNYNGYNRVTEPHVLGIHNGKIQFLGYQIGGSSSSGGIPEWRRFDLTNISDLIVGNQDFPGSRPFPSGRHSTWDQELMIVDL